MADETTRTALITGASRGLGLALAWALAGRGWHLIIDARGAAELEAVRAELAVQTRVTAVAGDITDPAHREALASAVKAAGNLDALVNNASLLGPSPQPALLEYPIGTLARVYLTNVLAPLALLQLVVAYLKPDARIVNVTSDAGVEAYAGWGGYGSSKAALEHLTAILAAENPDRHIYWVDPGDMNTQMLQEAYPGEDVGDRPLPDASVPGFLTLLGVDGSQPLPSGRYAAREIEVAHS